MVPKVKETPAPSKAEAKAQALEARKAVLKDAHSHKSRKTHPSPTYGPGHCNAEGTHMSSEEHPGRNNLDHCCAVIKFPLTPTQP
ncbi:hypothetical protein J0S82_016892 [Galemys pyrenaicus]|uniref:Large ribosomal subunit protein uL23 N-terminal domain-containing protein n=1 Tax=Galemys pyrenaicus TaxID=202257 RepID=A0A8J6AFX0_GALPY|nr:hypothetical protein J0S82_016892 [Galemys pyrenaicus]